MSTTRIHPRLPIFAIAADEGCVLYAPGGAHLASASVADEACALLADPRATAGLEARAVVSELVRRAEAAMTAWHSLAGDPFEPECLTLYLSNRCNLGCAYCYAAPEGGARERMRGGSPVLTEPVIAAGARLVADACARKGRPLTLVCHGGGEPTFHWDLLLTAWSTCAGTAADRGIGFWSYIATHGVLAEGRAESLARHFDLIGLSCDGPPDIQDANRPSASGLSTAAAVERTARVLRAAGAAFTIRSTIVPASADRQREIVEYLCDRLFAKTIRFEPSYEGRQRGRPGFAPPDAEAFVAAFLEARMAATARGCDLQLSGVRIDEIHGPFCNPLRQVLQLTPNGQASACFLSVGIDAVADEPMAVGGLDPTTGRFVVDPVRLAEQRRRAAAIPARCETCHNMLHCARDCPDVCLLDGQDHAPDREGFRCRVQKLLGRHLIVERARESAGHARDALLTRPSA